MAISLRNALNHIQKFSVAPAEEKKLGKMMSPICRKISSRVHKIGLEFNELAQKDKSTIGEAARIQNQIRITRKLESLVNGFGAAVDQLLVETNYLKGSKQIEQVVKFEGKLEKTSEEILAVINIISPHMGKSTARKLKAIAEDLTEISEKCRASKKELNEIQASTELKPRVSKKINPLTKFIYSNPKEAKGVTQRFIALLADQLHWLLTGKIAEKFRIEINTALNERVRIKERLDAAQTITELNSLLPHITQSKEHLAQMISITAAMVDKLQDKPQEEAILLLKNLNVEWANFDAYEQEINVRKEILQVNRQVDQTSNSARNMSDFDLLAQLDLKKRLLFVETQLNNFQNLSSNNNQLKNQIADRIKIQNSRLENYLIEADETGLTKEDFLNYIERFKSQLKTRMVWENSQKEGGSWNPERLQAHLGITQLELTHLDAAAKQYFRDDREIQQKLLSTTRQLDRITEMLEESINARIQGFNGIKKDFERDAQEMKRVLADKKLTPREKIIRLQEIEGDIRTSRSVLRELKISSKSDLYPEWKLATDFAEKLVARSQIEVAKYEAKIQLPAFRASLQRIEAEKKATVHSRELTLAQKRAKLTALACEVSSIQDSCDKIPITKITKLMSEHRELKRIVQNAGRLKKSIERDLSHGQLKNRKHEIVHQAEAEPIELVSRIDALMLNGMNLAQVQERYGHLKAQELVPDLEADDISQLFQKELRDGAALENSLKSTLIDMGVSLNDFPQDEIEHLTILLLLARNRPEPGPIIRSILLSFIQIAQRNNPQYQDEALQGKVRLLDQFDFSEKMQLSPMQSPHNFQLEDLIYLQNVLQQPDSLLAKTIQDEMHHMLQDQCLAQFKHLCEELKQPMLLEDDQILKKSISVMAILNFLSKNYPMNDQNERVWGDLFYKFKEVLSIKKTSQSLSVRQQLDRAFEQYQALIEDGFVAYRMKEYGGSAEHVTNFLYGRSEEQLELLKTRNREKVAEKLTEYSEQIKMGNPITIDMLTTLHSTYNQGVVPRHLSQLRKREHENIQFGKRVGVIPKDVEPAVQEVLDMANQLIKNPPKSELLYSIKVAQLHNSLLDIHPFLDRNGSTSLLFMELLVAVHRDYNPPKNRIKNYNSNLSMILNNSLAVAVVSYEHYKIAHRFGHYAPKSFKVDKATKKYYQNEIAKQKLRYQSEPIKKLVKKLWQDFEEVYKNAGQKYEI